MESLSVSSFLQLARDRTILDVRSPGEYTQGHIPGALSFPLFSDAERAEVGTLYKQQGPEAALELGLRFVGPKMADFVHQAKQLSPDKQLGVHCWRGGQRSRSMAWLLRLSGLEVGTLQGGYKAYRHQVLSDFEQLRFADLRVVGGRTGSGKTKILRALREQGQQVLDLEALAHHKGSAFGNIGEEPQPTAEQFENNLHKAIAQLDGARPVWTENESRNIGRVFIPEGLWQAMKAAPLYNVSIPHALRLHNLVQDYAQTDPTELIAAFQKIERRLGGQHLKAALEALQVNDFHTAADVALAYYDKTYQYCLDNNSSPRIVYLDFDHADAEQIAVELVAVIAER